MTFPTLAELLDTLRVVQVPLRVRFRGLASREAALVQGPAGWAEWSPFVEYEPAEASRWLLGTIEAGWHGFPTLVRERVPVNATVPAVESSQVASVLERFTGCTTAKVKVAEPGQTLADDVARVAAVRAAMGDDARIRLDANGGWTLPQAQDALARLADARLEYVEQPCMEVEDLARLREWVHHRGLGVPIAADESIRKAEDPLRVKALGAADVIVVKAPPLGGVASALRVIEQVGLPAVISSALDTSVGMRTGVALASALPTLDHACGLGTVRLLGADVTETPLAPVDGYIHLCDVTPDPELLRRWAAPADRERWWRSRLAECYALLA